MIRCKFVIPGARLREPGIHNHRGEYGFPDAQLRIVACALVGFAD
jgi:hypothetical protein